MVDARRSGALWRLIGDLPQFRRLLELRLVSQFGDGLFQAGLAGALLFNPDRAATPWAVAGAFAVLFLPYSLLGPFAGALLDRWDRRVVLVAANLGRLLLVLGVSALLASGNGDVVVLLGALLVNGFTRFVASGVSAALPHVVPRPQVVTMNSVATATGAAATFLGANFMLLPRWLFGADDTGAAVIILLAAVPVALALVLALRFPPRVLGPDDTARAIHGSVLYAVSTGWLHGARTAIAVPSVAATLSGLAAHRMVFGINTLLVLVIVRHTDVPTVAVAGLGTAVIFVAATGTGSFLATLATPAVMKRFGRFRTTNGALLAAAVIQLGGAGLHLPVMLVCGFLLGAMGQIVKLCADSAMQIDVEDPLRGHVFAVQDSVFWVSFIAAIAVSAAVIPADGHSPGLVLSGSVVYLAGLAAHSVFARGGTAAAPKS
ncbi:MFS transporter [Mycolicibacterium palauense]|uniref:MFS transporter n=1 Tax=Mycolicibacterium palauense TaxID=2034511 RepID=UPI000BFF0712|nr:MFS transporter [Mycolicibacterium palauense]